MHSCDSARRIHNQERGIDKVRRAGIVRRFNDTCEHRQMPSRPVAQRIPDLVAHLGAQCRDHAVRIGQVETWIASGSECDLLELQ